MLWNRNCRTFCLGGTRTRVHYGSGTGLDQDPTSNGIKKVKSKMRGQLSGKNNADYEIEKARFYTNFLLLENCARYCLDPEPEPEPKLFQSRNRNRNKSLRFHNIATKFNWCRLQTGRNKPILNFRFKPSDRHYYNFLKQTVK